MRGIRLFILAIAGVAAISAIALVKSALDNNTEVQVVKEREEIQITEEIKKSKVLVATRDLQMGETFTPDTMSWQTWPTDSVSSSFITKEKNPNARTTFQNTAARSRIVSGEPITESKMLNLDNASVMSVMLRAGMRAISIEIAPETGAGGFILPGDYVDVLLTTRTTNFSPTSQSREPLILSRHVLERVRVLAIDQTFNEKAENSAAAVGRTATLEVLPEQTTVIARAEEAGVVTLTLRSMSDLMEADGSIIQNPMPITVDKTASQEANNDTSIIVLRNGKATRILPAKTSN